MSEVEKQDLEERLRDLIKSRYLTVLSFLRAHASDLERLAATLVEYKTLSGAEVVTLLETGVRPNTETGAYRQRYSSRHLKNKQRPPWLA